MGILLYCKRDGVVGVDAGTKKDRSKAMTIIQFHKIIKFDLF
jgi:hypothetical protein